MPRIRPFVGLLYDTALTGPLEHLTTPPYDVIDQRDRERYHDASPFNVIRLIRGRDLPGDDDEGSNAYARAALQMRRWRSEGILTPTPGPAVFPYEFHFHDGGHERIVRGVIATADLEPFGHGVIAHERTMAGPERDRLALLRAVRANLSPVHAVYRGPSAEVRAFLDDALTRPPAAESTDAAGTRHRIWIRQGADADRAATSLCDQELMIADGHHRYSVALAFKHEMDDAVGPGPWDTMMMLLIDAATEEPPVLPVHRAVLAVPRADAPYEADTAAQPWRLPPAHAEDRVRDLAEILASLRDESLTIGSAWFEAGELVHRVLSLTGEPPAVRALHEGLLKAVGHTQLAFVPNAVDAEEMVRSGAATAAFFLPPTRVGTIRDAIAEGATLPEKSTYFWPKPLTGMVIRPFDP